MEKKDVFVKVILKPAGDANVWVGASLLRYIRTTTFHLTSKFSIRQCINDAIFKLSIKKLIQMRAVI